ncbi:tetratricopeptide repeat protein [Edaphobacter modestus]|uniref:Uncharacterized protein n=1 Tax=Edaphobacter modestus TaxID=388466 RepID=A0A4V6MFT1_9BACT|nr:hypothetical protein [Edaphobacter modestus]RZU39546.1 hypothetical protein BDD14_0931 [Edaphobacter modestus]
MMSRLSIRVLPLIALFAMTALVCAQTPLPAAPCPQKTDKASGSSEGKPQPGNDPCAASTGKEAPTAQRFPFPGESDPPKTQPQQNPPDAPAPGKPPSTADKFPFPTSAPPMPGSEPGSSSSGSSSSSSDDPANTPSADKPPLDDKADSPKPSGRRRLPKVEKLQTDEDRAEEDLKVSKFYEDAGNLNAAYLRAQDAVKSLPSDPETHFALAHVAEKLEKREEAIAEYNAYLKLNPDGLRIKQARKALEQLQH